MKPNRAANPNTQKNKKRLDAEHHRKLYAMIASVGVVSTRKRLAVSTETLDELRSSTGFGVSCRVVDRITAELDKNESTQKTAV